jgi:hypothetical protein
VTYIEIVLIQRFRIYYIVPLSSTHTQRLKLRTKSTDRINIPYHKLPINTARAYTSHRTRVALVRENGRNRVLMHREQFCVGRELRPTTGATAQAARICIAESVERGAIETAYG